MRIPVDAPVMIEIAKLAGVPVEAVENVIIHIEVPMGVMALYSLPTFEDYRATMAELAGADHVQLFTRETD